MMAGSIDVIKQHCIVSEPEEELLFSECRPIVLLERKFDSIIPGAVAPGVDTLRFHAPLFAAALSALERP